MRPTTEPLRFPRRAKYAVGVLLAVLGSAFSAADAGATKARDDKPVVIKVGRLHVGDGTTIDNAAVIILAGKITAVGPGIPLPSDASVIDLPQGALTPGLIDANAMIEPEDVVSRAGPGGPSVLLGPTATGVIPSSSLPSGPTPLSLMFHDHTTATACWSCNGQPACLFASVHEELLPDQNCPCCGYPTMEDAFQFVSGVERSPVLSESSSEVVPHTRVLDAMNLRSPDFVRLVRGGVTTVFISPDSSPVIGGQGAIVRTAGPITDRLIEPAGDVKAAMGTDSFSVGADNNPPFRTFVSTLTRRPNTRMGVTWVFRKAFYDARKWKAGEEPAGADTAPTEAFPVLDSILDGKVKLRMQARMQQDILTAIRLADEFDMKFTLVDGVEAYKCVDEIKTYGSPVIFGPIAFEPSGVRRFARDRGDARLSTVHELLNAGVEVAISAQDLREEDGLARQAMYAVRGGASPGEAIKAVTLTPAKMLGIDGETGSIAVGKRADLVVWSGEPLEATSRPMVVIIGGRTVMDVREAAKKN